VPDSHRFAANELCEVIVKIGAVVIGFFQSDEILSIKSRQRLAGKKINLKARVLYTKVQSRSLNGAPFEVKYFTRKLASVTFSHLYQMCSLRN
jgi:hypothetical protein